MLAATFGFRLLASASLLPEFPTPDGARGNGGQRLGHARRNHRSKASSSLSRM